MTTFSSRKAVRDSLVSFFQATDAWEAVYGYEPSGLGGQSPVLTLRSGGTEYLEEGLLLSPTRFRFIATSYVLVADGTGNWTADEAEDKVDELDQTMRELIRDNKPDGCDWLTIEEGFSGTSYEQIDSEIYRLEERMLITGLEGA